MQDDKPLKSTKLTNDQWKRLHAKLLEDHPLSTVIIRYKTRRVLGFTPRGDNSYQSLEYSRYIYLDWFDAKLCTMFCLRYSEYMNR